MACGHEWSDLLAAIHLEDGRKVSCPECWENFTEPKYDVPEAA